MAFVLKQIDVWVPLMGNDFEKSYSLLPNKEDFRHRILEFLRDPAPQEDAVSAIKTLHLLDDLPPARRQVIENLIDAARPIVLDFESRVELRCNVNHLIIRLKFLQYQSQVLCLIDHSNLLCHLYFLIQ